MAAVLLLVVAVPVAVILLEDDEPERVELPLPDPDRLIGPGASELASLLASGRRRTFHATYTLAAGDRRETLEWWNDGDSVRQDTTVAGDAGMVRTASIRRGGGDVVACRQDPGQSWACERVEAAVAGDPRGLLTTLATQLAGRPVAVRPDEVGGRDARCFSVAATEGAEAVELCTDADGIPLRLSSSEATLELTALDDDIPGDIFEPPADP